MSVLCVCMKSKMSDSADTLSDHPLRESGGSATEAALPEAVCATPQVARQNTEKARQKAEREAEREQARLKKEQEKQAKER